MKKELKSQTYSEYYSFLAKYLDDLSPEVQEQLRSKLLAKPQIEQKSNTSLQLVFQLVKSETSQYSYLYFNPELQEYYLIVLTLKDNKISMYDVTTLYSGV